jgi:4-diphosphocytidyl-2-C-methyl-D-erythritol kinase
MSGSGATCFGLFADPIATQFAAEQIAGAQPEWWVRAGRLIRGREELVEI